MQPEQKKVCNGECGHCRVREVSDCCKSEMVQIFYTNSTIGERPTCLECQKDCKLLQKVETPQFVSWSSESARDMTWLLNKYSQYHDFDIISQQTTTYSGFLGLGGSTTYSVTLKNK